MICEEALTLISAGIDGELRPEEEQALREHLAACPECKALAESLRGLDEKVAALRVPAPEGLKRGVLYRIDQAAGKTKKPKTRWFGPGAAVGAVAAVLVLLVGLNVIPLGQKTAARSAAKPASADYAAETAVPETAAPDTMYPDSEAAGFPANIEDGGNWINYYNYAGAGENDAVGVLPAETLAPMEPEPAKSPDAVSGGASAEDQFEAVVPVTDEVRTACAALSAEEDAMVLLYTEFEPKSLFSLLEAEAPALYDLVEDLELEERDGMLVCETDCGTALAIQEWLVENLPKSVILDADTAEAEKSLIARMEKLDPGSESLNKIITWTASRRSVLWPAEWPEGWADRIRTEENWEMFFPEEDYTPNGEKTAYLAFVP